MEITEVRVKLVEANRDRLKAFCSVTLDGDFVIRDLKIIDGTNGSFVAMPSRKLTDRCPKCSTKNHLRARFCNECGAHLAENRAPKGMDGRTRLHADVAHPINAACRERIQKAVIAAYEEELERSKQPGYRPVDLEDTDYDNGDYDSLVADLKTDARQRAANRSERRERPPHSEAPSAEPSTQMEKPPEAEGEGQDDFTTGIE